MNYKWMVARLYINCRLLVLLLLDDGLVQADQLTPHLNRGRIHYQGCIYYRDEDPDPFIFGPPDPNPVLFSLDPNPDPDHSYL